MKIIDFVIHRELNKGQIWIENEAEQTAWCNIQDFFEFTAATNGWLATPTHIVIPTEPQPRALAYNAEELLKAYGATKMAEWLSDYAEDADITWHNPAGNDYDSWQAAEDAYRDFRRACMA